MKPALPFLLLASCLMVFSSCEKSPHQRPQPPKLPVIKQGIQGKAAIELKIGSTNPLDGLELVLCRPEVEKAVIETRDTKWLENASPRTFGNGYDNLDLHAMGRAALHYEVQRATTDGFGQFSLAGMPPGSYIIYGQYKSRYAAGYWLVPVTVEAGKVTSLDLSNANMKEIYNRQ